jgi:hypothetical protein
MSIIKSFGHFWDRQPIDERKNNFSLLGHSGMGKKKIQLDFSNQSGIYLLHKNDREIVYIGQTGSGNKRLYSRLKDHTKDHLWNRWTHFSWFGFLEVDRKELKLKEIDENKKKSDEIRVSLDEIEAVLIQMFELRLNKQGPKWHNTPEFWQVFKYQETEEE